MQQLARQAAQLEVDGVAHRASHVYFCQDLSRRGRERDPWRCRSAVTNADDTLHTTEFPHVAVPLPGSARLRLLDDGTRPAAELIKVGVGPLLELHGDGYVAARRLTVDEGGAIELGDLPKGRRLLLFALFRHDPGWVRKHVWVLERR